MTKKSEITQKKFDRLLEWLDKDKEAAAEKYKSIHQRLVKMFLARNAFPADELADQAMDVAIQKINSLVKEYEGEPALYFYAVANNIFFEYLRKPKDELLNENFVHRENGGEEVGDTYYECLNKCLKTLPPDQRKLIVDYFRYGKQKKIDHHKKMAKKVGLDVKALRTRVYRIRVSLESCVQKCAGKKNV